MNCENCGTEVHGELKVLEQDEEEPFIAIVGTPDRDWILCDGCNALTQVSQSQSHFRLDTLQDL